MAFTGPLKDRTLIRERFGAYADAASRGDAEAWLANWADDCTWRPPGQELRGKESLRGAWDKIWEPVSKICFSNEIGAIEVQGDRATARSFCTEVIQLKTGQIMHMIGSYSDVLVHADDIWFFAERNYEIHIREGGILA